MRVSGGDITIITVPARRSNARHGYYKEGMTIISFYYLMNTFFLMLEKAGNLSVTHSQIIEVFLYQIDLKRTQGMGKL